jgi:2-phosphosulfolactate phosphatase
LKSQDKSVVLLCSGWKNSFNLEDTLFAGAVVAQLKPHFEMSQLRDAALAAEHLYNLAKDDIDGFLVESSHRKRLHKLQIDKDIEYCLTPNQSPVVPGLVNGALVDLLKM